ncbi:MAG: RNA degradosome polyphosphate kinase [Epsilonproteobacteria bacterium]|nr:RNA degradosome polyphosphate kinase [Campylobacterota bacterium]
MINLNNPKYYINRELSWLKFNSRVLAQSNIKKLPLLERLKFIAIYATNLDEFYMIRVAGLKQLFAARVVESGPDRLTPLQQLREIRAYLNKEKTELVNSYKEIVSKLKKEGLFITEYDELDANLQKKADEYFFEHLFPIVIPIAVDSTHPFPHLNNLSFALAVKLTDKDNKTETKYGMVRISRVLPRFVQVDDSHYIPVESLVTKHIESLFPGFVAESIASFRVTRNADIVIEEEEADDFMEILEQGLKLRKKGAFVRLEISKGADEDIIEFLNSHLKIFPRDIYEYDIPLNLGTLWQIVGNQHFAHLTIEPYKPKLLPPFEENSSVFEAIENGESILIHPYESFEPVTKLIQSASKDPKTLSIRMTLYRVEKNSPIISALIDAANNGIQVTVMVELKARFDEENNLVWAKSLEKAGAHVVYGISGLKVHAKITQVIRKVDNKLKFYIHLATGNYNGATAKIYSDVSFFTSREEIVTDSTTFFHILTGFAKKQRLKYLSMSPTQIKPKLLSMINAEIAHKEKGRIILKANSLVDQDVIKALYKASMAGVKCDLIIRGICCLKPGIKGVSENINVISIVGKYLEHARIYYFEHAPIKMYISSADLMPRNLERRIELMTPIEDERLSRTLREILDLQLADNELSWKLYEDEIYRKITRKSGEKEINSHEILETFINKMYKSFYKIRAKKEANLAKKFTREG